MKKSTRIIFIVISSIMSALFVYAGIMYFIETNLAEKSNNLFICGQCALYLVVTLVPLLMRKLKLEVPDFVYLIFIGFCVAHFLLGEILGFFATVSWWDSALHTISGMLITLLSFSLITVLNNEHKGQGKVSVVFACLFAFCVSLTIGLMWEIVEYLMDTWFDLNMQRAYVSTVSGERGAPLVGQEALSDTMKDLLLDAFGALVVSISAGVYIVRSQKEVEHLTLIKKFRHKEKRL